MREALRSAEDLHLTDAELDDLFDDLGVKDSGGLHTVLSYDVLHDVLTSGRYRRTDDGRYFVLLSLAEAETIRMIMHLRQGRQVVEPNSSPSPNPSPNPSPSPSPSPNPNPNPNPDQVVEGKAVALALRCITAHDTLFDQTDNFPPPPRYQAPPTTASPSPSPSPNPNQASAAYNC